MTHKERMLNSIANKPVDIFPHGDGLWGETTKKYIEQGKLKEGEDQVIHFDMSRRVGPADYWKIDHHPGAGRVES